MSVVLTCRPARMPRPIETGCWPGRVRCAPAATWNGTWCGAPWRCRGRSTGPSARRVQPAGGPGGPPSAPASPHPRECDDAPQPDHVACTRALVNTLAVFLRDPPARRGSRDRGGGRDSRRNPRAATDARASPRGRTRPRTATDHPQRRVRRFAGHGEAAATAARLAGIGRLRGRENTASDRRDPANRPTRNADPSKSPAESRRCVGGYPVPLDSSAPVSRADRVPIRLRRQESDAGFTRPSSSDSKTAGVPGRELARRCSAQ